MIRRLALVASAASIGALALGSVALAHIDPDPAEAQAGSTLTVGFTVEHGCEGSPTVEIEMRLPDGVVDATPEPIDGWDEGIEDDIVSFAGGSLPADEPGTFEVTMTLPPTPDTTIYFPFVQRCEEGEIRWIALPDDTGDEPDEPAPGLELVGPVVTTTVPATTEPVTTEPVATDASTTESTSTEAPAAAPGTSVSAAAETTIEVAAPGTTVGDTDSTGDSNTGTIIFIVSVLAALVIGAIVIVTSRRKRAEADATAIDGDQ